MPRHKFDVRMEQNEQQGASGKKRNAATNGRVSEIKQAENGEKPNRERVRVNAFRSFVAVVVTTVTVVVVAAVMYRFCQLLF